MDKDACLEAVERIVGAKIAGRTPPSADVEMR